MFPTLGLFAALRCPELSSSTLHAACKRSPCLYSHSVATPARSFTISKRPASSSVGSTSKDPDTSERPAKVRRQDAKDVHSSNGLFTRDQEEGVDVKPKISSTPPASSTSASTTARSSIKGTIPLTGSSSLRKPTFQIGRNGQVTRKGPAPVRALSTSSSTATSSSFNGKERAADQNAASTSGPTYSAASIGPPRLALSTKNSYFPVATRNTMLKSIFQEFATLYTAIRPPVKAQRLASEHAVAQELTIYGKNNKFSYRTACIQAIGRLKKRPPASSIEETGTLEEYDQRLKSIDEAARMRLTLEKATKLTMDRASMKAHDYVIEIPEGPGGNIPTEEGGIKKCERCGTDYIVHGALSEAESRACTYHWGRLEAAADKTRRYSCCQVSPGEPGCVSCAHVFIEKDTGDLHTRVGFVHTSSLPLPHGATPLDMAALDCELVYTTCGMSLARLTIIDVEGATVLDEFVKSNGMVVDHNTRWSGVIEDDLEYKAKMDINGLRQRVLGKHINENTILIGHGLENDLKALRLVHPPGRVIDTIQLFPHARGLPYRNALRILARDYLKIFIQDTGAAGHSSAVDAKAALDLVKYKAAKVEAGLRVEVVGGLDTNFSVTQQFHPGLYVQCGGADRSASSA